MITDEQILELAKEHLEHFSFDNGAECAWTDFAATSCFCSGSQDIMTVVLKQQEGNERSKGLVTTLQFTLSLSNEIPLQLLSKMRRTDRLDWKVLSVYSYSTT